MEIVKQLLLNGVSMLLALTVAFFLLMLFSKKKSGCSCGGACGGSASGAPAAQSTSFSIDDIA